MTTKNKKMNNPHIVDKTRKGKGKTNRWSRPLSFCAFAFVFVLTFILPSSCSSIDCPLKHRVYTAYKLEGSVTLLQDTLSISTPRITGIDSVVINCDVDVDSFSLPISYHGAEDIFFFEVKSKLGKTLDTVKIKKLDYNHFESVDCNPSFFHTITGVEHTHHRIDSIVINNANVTYDASKAHFYIYFKDNVY